MKGRERVSIWTVLSAIGLFAVAAVLVAGLYSLYVGGDFSRSYSNRLMRLRVLLQFIAIILLMATLYFSGR
ncbi:MAG: twin transmembrane helix small protein [Alphaproteobacteria bacterium]|nr:twin transmembrane helix small protein [Alphaproteobacteria bacterium]